jgi:hypothetical protein
VQTFKSGGQLYHQQQLKISIFNFIQVNRGDFTRPQKECLRLNVMTAAKMPQCLSSLKQASLFTVAHASRNALKIDEEVPI